MSWLIPYLENSNGRPEQKPFNQNMHLKIPRFTNGLKLSIYKFGFRVVVLHLMPIWRARRSVDEGGCLLQLLLPRLPSVLLLEKESWYETVTQVLFSASYFRVNPSFAAGKQNSESGFEIVPKIANIGKRQFWHLSCISKPHLILSSTCFFGSPGLHCYLNPPNNKTVRVRGTQAPHTSGEWSGPQVTLDFSIPAPRTCKLV